ncbi:hypothetical protein VHEMI10514 [[Torrubiella] hemipterigena]|uniref:RRM domain-containing protein n=1 Tax=[Torrubiella] hemipterigena TaxID=1531966 RepID=A0A0A1TD91_9HYPO|nr:hypothetical protein VHEMI10514 [[Torrubiella] hemipterigena]
MADETAAPAATNMDRGLDEIIADKRTNGPRNNRRGDRRGGDRRGRDRQDQPRDGVRKSYRSDNRGIDSEWVHDRFEDNDSRKAPAPRRRREDAPSEPAGTKIKVENIHYDLTEDDLDELFKRIGPIVRLQLRYDRAGRSLGTAYVTYKEKHDAEEAVKQFDGANANGQPIRLTILPSRNPFDNAFMPGRPLAERISAPGDRNRSNSPRRRYDADDAARKGIDRYIPGGGRDRSRSPGGGGHRRGGRRPGARRDAPRREGNDSGRGGRGNPRTKKSAQELDDDMADYFTGGANNGTENASAAPAAEAAAAPAPAPTGDDVDMIE